MRLIDADMLNKRLSEMEAEISEEDCMPSDAFSDGIISTILDIKQCIQNQGIVYDVDKIIKELESWTFNIDIDIDGTMVNRNLIVSDTAIDIVKAGGKEWN